MARASITSARSARLPAGLGGKHRERLAQRLDRRRSGRRHRPRTRPKPREGRTPARASHIPFPVRWARLIAARKGSSSAVQSPRLRWHSARSSNSLELVGGIGGRVTRQCLQCRGVQADAPVIREHWAGSLMSGVACGPPGLRQLRRTGRQPMVGDLRNPGHRDRRGSARRGHGPRHAGRCRHRIDVVADQSAKTNSRSLSRDQPGGDGPSSRSSAGRGPAPGRRTGLAG